MFNFRRFLSIFHTETEEEFRLRMERFQRDMDNLQRKQPEEIAGDLLEPTYYGLKMSQTLAAGEEAEARHFLSEMLRTSPTESLQRLAASIAYKQFGEESEAVAQLGIALALEPENYAVHPYLARCLMKRGERQAAKAILERGWGYYRKHLSKGDQKAKKAEYFSLIDHEQTV